MTTRLHIILILTIVAVAVYMFLLYKELRIFEKDILQLRAQVNSLTMNMTDMKSKTLVSQCVNLEKDTPTSVIEMNTDDDESVASEEIRDLIDTIHNSDAEEVSPIPEPEPIVVIEEPEPLPKQEPVESQVVQEKTMQDMDEEELGAQSLDALKTFLKEQGVAIKGRSAKRDLIQHILHLRKPDEQSEEDA